MLHGGTDPHHVHQGIHGTHFMKVHRIGAGAMHGGLRLRKSLEHRQHALLQSGIQGGCLDPLTDVQPLTMGWIRLESGHRDAQTPKTGTATLLAPELVEAGKAQISQSRLDHRRRNAKIQQSRQQHVPRHPCRTVDVKRKAVEGLGPVHRPSLGASARSVPTRSSSWERSCRSCCSISRRARRCSR